jgi:glycerol kinase
MTTACLLAIDQGTTSTRAILFDADGRPLAIARRELPQIYPRDGWVEHDGEEIWRAVLDTCREVLAKAEADVAAIGITNQRETTLIWDRDTGRPIHNAIVWQDRRTADACRRLSDDGHGALVAERTGLLLDPYFSGTKIAWLLDNVPGARARAERGELAFGTVDSFLLWRLTGGRVHATDATNASRTLLYNIHELDWDPALAELLDVPMALLPEARDSAGPFGLTDADLFGRAIPITGIAGDQQAALIGQACFEPGMVKSTYGTGCFVVMNTGAAPVVSRNRLLTTVAYKIDGQATYALEGSIFAAGAAVQWLRDGLKLIEAASETEALAASLEHNKGVYLVPAFTGLGAPHWDPRARGAIFGLTRDTGIAEIARATLEAVAYQTHDLIAAMAQDWGAKPSVLRVDGGMVANAWLLQFLADIIDAKVERPALTETTALGAAYLAGLGAGLYASFDDIAPHWRRDAAFTPAMDDATRRDLLAGWTRAVARVRETGDPG